MNLRLTLAALACALAALTLGVSRADAATISLLLPQSNAFAILGASCGGIQEQAFAAGFDPTTGYPIGSVLLSTRCGGSGRGGGYHVTTYSASVAVEWDFTGAVVSATTPATSPVNGSLAVFDAYGNEVYNQSNAAFLALAPSFVPAPRLTGITPSSGPAAGGTSVTITGTGLAGATSVSFGALPARTFSVTSATSITAVAPASSAGTVDVTIGNVGGTSATLAADRFSFIAAPSVSAIAPRSGPTTGGTTVTITGSNFTGATAVRFGGTASGFSVDSDTSITATAPAAEATGNVDIAVTTSGGTSVRTSADRFSYTAAPPAVGLVSPSSGPASGGTVVTILGSSLTRATRVAFGGTPAQFTATRSGTITAVSPPGSGTVDITVTTAAGTSALSPDDEFTYEGVPTIDAVSPNTGAVDGGTFVVVTGSGLTDATEIDFGGVPAEFAVVDDGTLYAVSPPATAGIVDVTVTTPAGTSDASAGDAFTYVDAPTVSGVTPNTGSVVGGDIVTITGAGFTDALEVDFGGVPADFTVLDDGTITAVTPAGASGTVDVVVTGLGGSSAASADDAFTYTGGG